MVRLCLSAGLLLLAAQAAANKDPDGQGIWVNAVPCVLIALGMAVPPLLLRRFRSLHMFSWLLLIAAFFQLYARRDGLYGASVAAASPSCASLTARSS